MTGGNVTSSALVQAGGGAQTGVYHRLRTHVPVPAATGRPGLLYRQRESPRPGRVRGRGPNDGRKLVRVQAICRLIVDDDEWRWIYIGF